MMVRRTSATEQRRKSLNVEQAQRADVAVASTNFFHIVVEELDESVEVVDCYTSTVILPQYLRQRSPEFCRATLISRYSLRPVLVLADGEFGECVEEGCMINLTLCSPVPPLQLTTFTA